MKVKTGLLLVLFCVIGQSGSALDVYLIRHGETVGNTTGDYSPINQATFSPRGLEQVAAVPEKLKGFRFDCVMVSPTWRTQQTILPFLEATGQKAEIWPEVEEVDCGITGDVVPSASVNRGTAVEIVEGAQDLIACRDEVSSRRYAPTSREEGVRQLMLAVDLVKSRFGGSDKSVLIVTHSCAGGRLMELFLGLKPSGRFSPKNATLSHLRQTEDGRFELVSLNEKPLTDLDRFLLTDEDVPPVEGFVGLGKKWLIQGGDREDFKNAGFNDQSWATTTVPGGWEKDALPDYDGIAWYRIHFQVTEEMRAKWPRTGSMTLILGAVDDADETFLNGQKIGSSGEFPPAKVTAWDQPRFYMFDVGLLAATNVLAVRVSDWGGGGGIWRGPVVIGPESALPAANPSP